MDATAHALDLLGGNRYAVLATAYFQQGKVMSPEDLGVGQHELSLRITDPAGVYDTGIMFFVDAAGTGACLSA